MAVTSCQEIWSGRAAMHGNDNERRYTRAFRVRTDTTVDGPLQMDPSVGFPALGEYYADSVGNTDLGAYCTSLNASQDQNDPQTWLVTVEYSSNVGQTVLTKGGSDGRPEQARDTLGTSTSAYQSPTARPPVIRVATQKHTRPLTKAYASDGGSSGYPYAEPAAVAVVNAAGDTYDPLPEIDDSRIVITVSRNELYLDLPTLLDYRDSVNKYAFSFAGATCAARTVKLSSIEYEAHFENQIFYWTTTYTLELDALTWDIAILEAGYNALDVLGNKHQIIDEKTGVPVTSPRLLDKQTGEELDFTSPDMVNYTTYRGYRERDFAALGLPT